MSMQTRSKLNQLLNQWPHGVVFTTSWLNSHGISYALIQRYRNSKWIESVGRGAVKRYGDKVEWSGAVYALQKQLGINVHVGGKTVLQLRGYGRNIPLKKERIYLFAGRGEKLPNWFREYDWGVSIDFRTLELFKEKDIGLKEKEFNSFTLTVSTLERAVLELLSMVPQKQSYEESLFFMEGLVGLRPELMQRLLENCRSIKVKRLFMHLAEKVGHSWFAKIDILKIDFGKGKRSIVKGGTFDSKYNITVPDVGET